MSVFCPRPVSFKLSATFVVKKTVFAEQLQSIHVSSSDKMPQNIKNRRESRSLSKQEELLNVQTQYFVKLEDLKLTKKDRALKFLWDSETKKFCGRTASSWCKFIDFKVPIFDDLKIFDNFQKSDHKFIII